MMTDDDDDDDTTTTGNYNYKDDKNNDEISKSSDHIKYSPAAWMSSMIITAGSAGLDSWWLEVLDVLEEETALVLVVLDRLLEQRPVEESPRGHKLDSIWHISRELLPVTL